MSTKMHPTLNDVFEEREQAEARAEKDRQRELRLKNALVSVLSTEQGQLGMSWVLSYSSLDSSISVNDSLRMAVLSGRRDVGLEITKKLRALCPEFLEKLNKETE